VLKTRGKNVIGGSVNLYGTIVLEVTKTGSETFLAGIIRAVEDAQAKKPRLQILADRLVGYFVPFILFLASVTAAGYLLRGGGVNAALMAGVSVLVIACPCSLGLATPLAVLVFTTMASSRGILIKNGEVIENMSRVTHAVFDKTGTLTEGRPSLKEVILLDGSVDREYICSMAASMENLSEHSLGRAIITASGSPFLPVRHFRAIPGRGVTGTIGTADIFIGNRTFMEENEIGMSGPYGSVEALSRPYEKAGDTVICMGWDGQARALFVVADCLRPEAADSVGILLSLGMKVSLASGDTGTTVKAVASAAGIPHAASGMSPEKKRTFIRELQKKNIRVMMAGDGINDAPALTESAVGIAMGRGTDIAMESADAVLVRNDLMLIPYFVRLSRHAYHIIRQNIFWAFFYNIVALPLAVSGMLHPIVAAGAMAASSLFVVVNSLRIRREVKS
jgi:Cu2+-exporting ATPase